MIRERSVGVKLCLMSNYGLHGSKWDQVGPIDCVGPKSALSQKSRQTSRNYFYSYIFRLRFDFRACKMQVLYAWSSKFSIWIKRIHERVHLKCHLSHAEFSKNQYCQFVTISECLTAPRLSVAPLIKDYMWRRYSQILAAKQAYGATKFQINFPYIQSPTGQRLRSVTYKEDNLNIN